MKVESIAETISSHDGVAEIAFDLAGSDAGYLLIALPEGPGAADGFFGQDHYVEVRDQRFGRYGGLGALQIKAENELAIQLNYEVPGIGSDLTVLTRRPISPSILSCLRALERP